MASQSLTPALRETLQFFDGPGIPYTTTEVAEYLDLGRRSTYERLDRLVEQERLETKKVGGNGRVWWEPAREGQPGQASTSSERAPGRTSTPPERTPGQESTPPERTPGRESTREQRTDHDQFERLIDAVEEYAIFRLDTEGIVQTWNPGAERIKGYEAEEILGRHFSTFYTDDDREDDIPAQNLAQAEAQGSVEDEGWRVRADGSLFWANVTITAIEDDDGTLEGYAKVTRDMTDRREHEEQLRQQGDYTQQILETTPVDVLTVEPDGTFSTANQQAVELLELDDDADDAADGELTVGINAVYDEDGTFLSPEERPYVRAFETAEPVRNWHAQIELSTGTRRWLSTNIEPMVDGNGEVEQVLVTIDDISQQKAQARRLERERDDLEAELEDIFERVDDGFFALDENFRLTYVNEYVSSVLSRPAPDLVEESVWDAFDLGRDARDAFETAMEAREPTSFEFFHDRFDAWFEFRVYASEEGLSVYFRDVSERKEREIELERYRTTVETVWDGVTTLDSDDRFVMVNEAFCEMSGYERDEIIGAHATRILQMDDYETAGELHDQVESGNLDIATLEYDLQTADGGSIPVEARFGPCEFEDGSTGGTGVIRDVRERKQRQQRLEQYRQIIETVDDGIYVLDGDRQFTTVNEEFASMAGYDRAELVGSPAERVFDEHFVDVADEKQASLASGETDVAVLEEDLHRKDGSTLDVESRFALFATEDGETGRVGITRDITERRERVRELKRFEVLFTESRDVNVVLKPDGTYSYVTPSMQNELGHDPVEMVGENAFDYVHPDDRERVFEEFARLVEDPDLVPSVEYRFRRADGSWARLESRGRNLLSDPEVEGIVVYSRDVTERYEREQELERALDMLHRTERIADVGGWEIDPTSMDVFWTQHIYDLIGFPHGDEPPLSEALDMYHEDDRPVVEYAIQSALETGNQFDVEARIRTADDDYRWLQIQGIPETDDGEVVTLRGAAQDVTERKERERTLERQREQLVVLNSHNELVRDITDAVINQSTREEIETIVCDRLAATDSYEFAWIGDVDVVSDSITVRTEAGIDGSLDDRDATIDPTEGQSTGSIVTAFQTGEVQTTPDLAADASDHPRGDPVEDDGVRSAAAIPLVHEDTIYGVLNVYAEQPFGFEGQAGRVIGQLGEILGHAIAAADRKRALMSDEVVELQFEVRDVFDELDLDLDGPIPETIEFEHAVPIGDDEFIVYGSVAGEEVETVLQSLVDAIPHWDAVTVRETNGGNTFQLRLSEPPVLSKIASLGASIEHAAFTGDVYRLTVQLAPSGNVRRVIDAVQAAYPQSEMIKREQRSRPEDPTGENVDDLLAALTERQRTALEVAVFSGYFEWPREASGEEVAESIGIAAPTFSQHIRKAQKNVFESVFAAAGST